MKYQFDILYQIYMLLPPVLRKPVLVYFIKILLAPVAALHAFFIQLKTDTDYWLSFTGQVVYLEYLLSKEFGAGITIADGILESGTYIAHIPNSDFVIGHKPDPESAYIAHMYAGYATDFFILIPAAVFDTLTAEQFNKMQAIIEKYRLIGKTYEFKRV